MAALPYIQLYVADYLADTFHLTAEEHGAYMLLIMNYWQTGKPLSKEKIQKLSRVPKDRWPEVEKTLSEFFEDNGKEWKHKRIEADLLMVREGLKKKAAAGKASAEARKLLKQQEEKEKANKRSTDVEQVYQQEGNEKATIKDLDLDLALDQNNKQPCASGDAPPADPPKPEDELYSEEFNRFWKAYPSKKGKKPAAEKFRAARKKNPSPEFLSRLIEDVECRARGREWTKSNGQFIPHAATYLNQERWNDPAPNVSQMQSRHTGFDNRDYSEGLIEGVSDDAANF